MTNLPTPSPLRSSGIEPIALTAAVLTVLAFAILPNALDPLAAPFTHEWFAGADTYMRLVRVREWLANGEWYANLSPRSNWPDGETLHWTRPLDLLLVALALPLWPFAGGEKALYLAGVLSGPLLLVALLAILVKGLGVFFGARGRVLLVLVAGLQPGVQHAFMLARPDHHALILLAFSAVLVALARYAQAPRTHSASASWAGLACAFGLWVSIETLVMYAVALMALGLPWLARGHALWLDAMRRFALAAAIGLGLALLIERPPADWLGSETYDRLSTVHVVMGALIAMALHGLARMAPRLPQRADVRFGAAAAAAVLVTVVLGGLYPDFFKGPFGAAMDPRLTHLWLGHIDEFQPLRFTDTQNAVTALLFLGGPVLWTAAGIFLARRPNIHARQVTAPALPVVLIFALFVTAFTVLTLMQMRWAGYVGLAAALPWTFVLIRVLDWHGGPRLAGVPVLRAPLFILVAVGHVLTAWALDTAAAGTSPSASLQRCDWRGLSEALNSESFTHGHPQTLFTYMDKGPELLYRTHHRVVGTPYHRNAHGLLDTFDVFSGQDLDRARAILTRRGVDYVISCVNSPEEAFFLRIGEDTLIRRIHDGRLPDWLRTIPLPEGAQERFRVLRIQPAR